MRARMAWSATALVAATTWLGCTGQGVFLCETSADCQREGSPGVCQPTGYCSFPDDACDSGQRYGDHAGGSLSETCVEQDASTTTATGATTIPGGSGSGAITRGQDATSLDDGTTVNKGTAEGSDPDSSESTAAPVLECDLDDFEDGRLDSQWCTQAAPGLMVQEYGGELHFDLDPSDWDQRPAYADLQRCRPFALHDATVSVQIDHTLHVSPLNQSFLEVGSDQRRLGLGVLGDHIDAFVVDGSSYDIKPLMPYDAHEVQYWRIRGVGGALVAEISIDGSDYREVHSMELDPDDAVGNVRLGVWCEEITRDSDYAQYDSLEVCSSG